jgi:CBS domain-containing protein
MRCEEIMKKSVECIAPKDTVEAAARRMRDENVGFLPVCDASGKVLGTLTDRDIAIRVVAKNGSGATPVEKVMTAEVISCSPSDTLTEAQELMAKHQKSRIMCIDESDRLVGVISLSDIAQHDGKAAKTLQQVSERESRP